MPDEQLSRQYHFPTSRRRYLGVYMVFECYRNEREEIPIISVNVTSVAHASAVASVRMHPNPFINQLTRGINVFIVCKMCEFGVDSHPKNYVMFIGDITSVQMSANAQNTEYVINLVDNRRYISELPTFYLKLIRTWYDMHANPPAHTRKGGPNGETIISLVDKLADANFYGIDGIYSEDEFYYDVVKDPGMIYAFMEEWTGGSLHQYIDKMLDPMRDGKGWEPYYINMNKKKRITSHLTIWDDGIFRSDISANFLSYAMGVTHAIKDAHAEFNTTYEDAVNRLAELGYMFNTNLFPAMEGGEALELKLEDGDDPIYKIKSTLFNGELIGICSQKEDGQDIDVWRPQEEFRYKTSQGAYRGYGSNINYFLYASKAKIYSAKQGDITYYAIVNPFVDAEGNLASVPPKIKEFSIVPKMYGVIPPKCNWGVVDDSTVFNCIIAETPITALKYNLVDGNSALSMFSYAYPGGLEVYGNYQEESYDVLAGTSGMRTLTKVQVPASYRTAEGETLTNIQIGQKLYLSGNEVVTHDTQKHANRGSNQGGTDIAMPRHTPIEAYAEGHVKAINNIETKGYGVKNAAAARDSSGRGYLDPGFNAGWGQQVIIETKGSRGSFSWIYAHLHDIEPSLRVGDYVWAGRIIGTCGNTGMENPMGGAHLHLSIKEGPWTGNGDYVNAKWVNTSWLFGNLGYPPPRIITEGQGGSVVPGIITYDLSEIATNIFVQEGAVIQEASTVQTESGETEVHGKYIKPYPNKYHNKYEHIYGIKRVSTQGSGLYEIEKASQFSQQYADSGLPPITQKNKFALLKAKVVQDFHESRISRNTGTLTIDGLDENIMVGFPYILYHPGHDIFYYGFVAEVSHRIDNSAGQAYTEVQLNSLTTAHSIKEIEDDFAGYTKKAYVGKDGLNLLNELYARMTLTKISETEYDAMDITTKIGQSDVDDSADYQTALNRKRDTLITMMSRGLRSRTLCTIERLQNYMYKNKNTVERLEKPASEKSKTNQWLTPTMRNTIENVIRDYVMWQKTDLYSKYYVAPDLEKVDEEEPTVDQSSVTYVKFKVELDDSTNVTGWEENQTEPDKTQ